MNAIQRASLAPDAYESIVIPVPLHHRLLQLGLLFEDASLRLLGHLIPVGFDDKECEYYCNEEEADRDAGP